MNKKLVVVAAVAAACCALSVEAKPDRLGDIKERTQAKEFVGAEGKVFRYRLAEKMPEDGSRVPLVLFLHGAGERGTNNVAQLVHGVGELVRWAGPERQALGRGRLEREEPCDAGGAV